jgi:hypothetical protein
MIVGNGKFDRLEAAPLNSGAQRKERKSRLRRFAHNLRRKPERV